MAGRYPGPAAPTRAVTGTTQHGLVFPANELPVHVVTGAGTPVSDPPSPPAAPLRASAPDPADPHSAAHLGDGIGASSPSF